MLVALPAVSMACVFFINTPFFASLPDATAVAKGAARPNAHGHAAASTEIKTVVQKPIVQPLKNQNIAAKTATDTTK